MALQSGPPARGMAWSGIMVLVAAGLAGGYLMPGGKNDAAAGKPEKCENCAPADPYADLPPCCRATALEADAQKKREFALTDADRKETAEAPSLAFDGEGRLFAVWASQTGENEKTLFLATSLGGGATFDPPRAIRKSGIFSTTFEAKGKTVKRTAKMSPHLVATADKLIVSWSEAAADNSTVHLLQMESDNGGLSFSEPVRVNKADDARPTYTGFTSGGNGMLAASWLDRRSGVQLPALAVRAAGASEYAEEIAIPAGDEGKGICPCCPTATVIADDGTVYVAFRNQLAGKRDMFLAKWSAASDLEGPFPVVEPTWEFDGCPHDGPSLAVDSQTLHLVWMDAHTGPQRVYYGKANRGDLKFEVQPLHAAGPGTQGNAAICLTKTGDLHAVWEESAKEPAPTEGAKAETGKHDHGAAVGGGRRIMHTVARKGGAFETPHVVLLRDEDRFQTRPAMAAAENGKVVIAFQELDENGKRVVIGPSWLPPELAEPSISAVSK